MLIAINTKYLKKRIKYFSLAETLIFEIIN